MIEKRFNLGMKGSLIKSLLQRLLPGGEIDAAMLNKADNSLGEVPVKDLLAWAIQQTQSGPFVVNPAVTTEGLPQPGLWYTGRLDIGSVGGSWHLILYGSHVIHTNGTSAGLWTGWESYYDDTPPEEYDLPLAAGYIKADQHKCCYSKAQDGTVLVHIAINYTSGTLPVGSVCVATLPVGYRPSGYVGRSISATDRVRILPDGRVMCETSTPYALLVDTLDFRVA